MRDPQPSAYQRVLCKFKLKPQSCLIAGTLIIIAGLLVFAFVARQTLHTVEKIVTGFQQPFLESHIQETFRSTAFKTQGNEGGILEVATATSTQTFKKKSEFKLFDTALPLGTTVSEIQIPATYRYHIDLNDGWQIQVHQQQCVVIAPKIRPTLPVAFDTGKMKSKTASGWARWDKHDNLKTLQQSLTEKLASNAVLPKNIDLIREDARLSIAKFIRNWLTHHQHWSEQRFNEIIVIFPDEAQTNAPLPAPTLRLKTQQPPPALQIKESTH